MQDQNENGKFRFTLGLKFLNLCSSIGKKQN